jgi:hypothetical protein
LCGAIANDGELADKVREAEDSAAHGAYSYDPIET